MSHVGFCPAGVMFQFGGATAPDGWLLCDGTAVSRTTYAALFNAISTAWGYGDNSTTFNLPDMRGRFPRGKDGGIARDPDRATRTAAATGGNTGDNVGSVQGNQNLSHNHGGSSLPRGGVGDYIRYGTGSSGPYSVGGSAGGTLAITSDIASDGGTESRPINANVNFIIKV